MDDIRIGDIVEYIGTNPDLKKIGQITKIELDGLKEYDCVKTPHAYYISVNFIRYGWVKDPDLAIEKGWREVILRKVNSIFQLSNGEY